MGTKMINVVFNQLTCLCKLDHVIGVSEMSAKLRVRHDVVRREKEDSQRRPWNGLTRFLQVVFLVVPKRNIVGRPVRDCLSRSWAGVRGRGHLEVGGRRGMSWTDDI